MANRFLFMGDLLRKRSDEGGADLPLTGRLIDKVRCNPHRQSDREFIADKKTPDEVLGRDPLTLASKRPRIELGNPCTPHRQSGGLQSDECINEKRPTRRWPETFFPDVLQPAVGLPLSTSISRLKQAPNEGWPRAGVATHNRPHPRAFTLGPLTRNRHPRGTSEASLAGRPASLP